jgi:hypothetical protein
MRRNEDAKDKPQEIQGENTNNCKTRSTWRLRGNIGLAKELKSGCEEPICAEITTSSGEICNSAQSTQIVGTVVVHWRQIRRHREAVPFLWKYDRVSVQESYRMFSSISDFSPGGCAGGGLFSWWYQNSGPSAISISPQLGFQPEQGAFLNLPNTPLRFGDVDQNREHRKFGTQKPRSGIKKTVRPDNDCTIFPWEDNLAHVLWSIIEWWLVSFVTQLRLTTWLISNSNNRSMLFKYSWDRRF